MSFPRLLLLLLLIIPCAATVAAQSSRSNSPFGAVPLLGAPAPPDSLAHIPGLAPKAFGETRGGPGKARFKLSGPNGRLALEGTPFGPILPYGLLATRLQIAMRQTLARNNSPCYTIRSYQFAQDDPSSDATRFAGSSSCLPGAQLMLKGAKDSHTAPPALDPASPRP
jgi:hypothetical protein